MVIFIRCVFCHCHSPKTFHAFLLVLVAWRPIHFFLLFKILPMHFYSLYSKSVQNCYLFIPENHFKALYTKITWKQTSFIPIKRTSLYLIHSHSQKKKIIIRSKTQTRPSNIPHHCPLLALPQFPLLKDNFPRFPSDRGCLWIRVRIRCDERRTQFRRELSGLGLHCRKRPGRSENGNKYFWILLCQFKLLWRHYLITRFLAQW